MYPKCYQSFRKLIASNENWQKIYNNLRIKPRAFDVSLRDGLQSLTKLEQSAICENGSKERIFSQIVATHKPYYLEVGSLCSEKVFPVFKDSIQLYSKLMDMRPYNVYENLWLLMANEAQLRKLEDNGVCPNLSLISSVSNSFQLKNTKMNVNESIQSASNILHILDDTQRKCLPLVKLYVSCINECPIEGKLSVDSVVNRLLPMFQIGVDKICLSDTCGTLMPIELDKIMRQLIQKNVSPKQLSLHLHVRNELVTQQVIHKALDYGIMEFDVSYLEGGGCSVTIDKKSLAPNLSYDLYYKSLMNWIIGKA